MVLSSLAKDTQTHTDRYVNAMLNEKTGVLLLLSAAAAAAGVSLSSHHDVECVSQSVSQ